MDWLVVIIILKNNPTKKMGRMGYTERKSCGICCTVKVYAPSIQQGF